MLISDLHLSVIPWALIQFCASYWEKKLIQFLTDISLSELLLGAMSAASAIYKTNAKND